MQMEISDILSKYYQFPFYTGQNNINFINEIEPNNSKTII